MISKLADTVTSIRRFAASCSGLDQHRDRAGSNSAGGWAPAANLFPVRELSKRSAGLFKVGVQPLPPVLEPVQARLFELRVF